MGTAKAIPDGFEGLIPHIVLEGCSDAIEFYKKAFGAEELFRMPAPDGKRVMHAELRLGGSTLYLADSFPEMCGGKARHPKALGGTPVTIHRYVNDVDAAVKQASAAGATVTMPPTDMFWGDRYGGVRDPWGHEWSLATHKQDLSPEQIAAAQKEAFAKGACGGAEKGPGGPA